MTSPNPYPAPTPDARAAMIALVAQAYRDGVYALHSHGHVTRCCERASEYAETVVPPLPTQPRRVHLYGELECAFATIDGFGTACFDTTDRAPRRIGYETFEDIVANAPKALRTKIAAQLLDLIASPTEPTPAAPVPVVLSDEELVKLYYAALTINKTARRYEAPANREVVTAMRAALAVAE